MSNNECVICLDNINKNDLLTIKHDLCKYTIHKSCVYNKCVYCHKILINNNNKLYTLYILDKLIKLFILIDIEDIIGGDPILIIFYTMNVFFIAIFIICPIIIGDCIIQKISNIYDGI
jgi:hypothetical protein